MERQFTNEELNGCLPDLNRYANFLTRDPDQALDLVQDSVERALRKQSLFNGGNLRAWLTIICRRLFLNGIRSRKSAGISVLLEDVDQRLVSVAAHQELHLHFSTVQTAFAGLNAADQLVISLVALEGMKYTEAAEVMNIPVGTVRSRLSRARHRLGVSLADRDDRRAD